MNTAIAHARREDVETSHLAAASVSNLNDKQRFVLEAFKENGQMIDEEMIRFYDVCESYPPQSPSGLRSRRSELVVMGKLRDSLKRRKTKSNRLAIIWELVSLLIFMVAVCGCSKSEQHYARVVVVSNSNTTNSSEFVRGRESVKIPHDDWNQTNPETWMQVMEIWHCESESNYQLKTSYQLRGAYNTLESAKASKTNWANEMVEFVKAGGLNFTIKTLPECGKRIE